jgi:5-methylcytosine-specific restriction endonuclease McrA
VKRPCIACGTPIPRGSRCNDCKLPNRAYERGTQGRTQTDWRWRKLSQAQRKRVPFCELQLPGCTGQADTTDHVLPVAQFPDLAREPLNLRSACRPCNAARGDKYTQAEQAQVLDAIAKRKRRAALYYTSQIVDR